MIDMRRIQDTGYRIQDTGYRIQDTGYRMLLPVLKKLYIIIFASNIFYCCLFLNYGKQTELFKCDIVSSFGFLFLFCVD